jgi:hypothetical protein
MQNVTASMWISRQMIENEKRFLWASLIDDRYTNLFNINPEGYWENRVEDRCCLGVVEITNRKVANLSALQGESEFDSGISSPNFGRFIQNCRRRIICESPQGWLWGIEISDEEPTVCGPSGVAVIRYKDKYINRGSVRQHTISYIHEVGD